MLALLLTATLTMGPTTEIEEFRQGPGPDNSTLVVVCASGRRIELVLKNSFIKEKSVGAIFSKLMKECERGI